MSISVDMTMQPLSLDLKKRLAVLTDDPAEYARGLRSDWTRVQRDPAFAAALKLNQALADERRLATVFLLQRRGELCACELQTALDVSHATVSHHMDQLLGAGLVEAERRGKWTYYRLRPGVYLPSP